MEPSSSAANANSSNPAADGIFQGLRDQLDSLQHSVASTAINRHRQAAQAGWRQRALENIGQNDIRQGRAVGGVARANQHRRNIRAIEDQLNTLSAMRNEMDNFDSMLDEIEGF